MTATRCKRLLALLLAAVMLLSVTAAAVYTPTDVTDAKDELATVRISQFYQGALDVDDLTVHNYATDGDEVKINYSATLSMTEEMAIYLQARQSQLLNAKFNVHVQMDLNKLEFTEKGDTLTVTFSSSFLKPWEVSEDDQRAYPNAFSHYKAGAYTSQLIGVEDGIFTYQISVDKAWATSYAAEHGYIDVPMELISYYDGRVAYGYEDAMKEFSNSQEKPMFYDFTVADWMKPIKVELAKLRVKDSVRDEVKRTGTKQVVLASGTVDGEFTYEKYEKIRTLADYSRADHTTTLEFGNTFTTGNTDPAIEEWKSNTVEVDLIYSVPFVPGPPVEPDDLNLTDHFAYVIGYPDGTVRPDRQITRAEVATIFFRMLKDEARNRYWSTTNDYTDVKKTDWHNNAISTLSNMGIINGYPDGSFHPNANITRAEFAKIAVSFFKDYVSQTIGDRFTDISGKWYTTYINLAAELGVVNGYPDGTFLPEKEITRAEAMKIVNNTLRRTPHKDKLLSEQVMNVWPDNSNKAIWYYADVQEATNSHEYERASLTDYETWLAKLPERDWAAFERAWSDANAAPNPGEVVDGSGGYLNP